LLTDPGDNILIPCPSYPLLDILCGLESIEQRYYKLNYTENKWEIDFDSIKKNINEKTKAIIVINPNNPTGNYISKKESDFLIRFCDKNKIALIVDEVFNDFSLSENKFSFTEAEISENSILFVLNGISKMLALPQLKLGWIINLSGDKKKKSCQNILEMISDTYLTVNTPVQNAFPVLLQAGNDIKSQIIKRITANYNFLNNHFASDSINSVLTVEGGWYAVIKSLSEGDDEQRVLYFLENHRVNMHPGYFYNFDDDGYLIISLIIKESEMQNGIIKVFR